MMTGIVFTKILVFSFHLEFLVSSPALFPSKLVFVTSGHVFLPIAIDSFAYENRSHNNTLICETGN